MPKFDLKWAYLNNLVLFKVVVSTECKPIRFRPVGDLYLMAR